MTALTVAAVALAATAVGLGIALWGASTREHALAARLQVVTDRLARAHARCDAIAGLCRDAQRDAARLRADMDRTIR